MFPVHAIHQIEMTSRCNLRCQYCTSPHLGRPKVDMSDEHYRLALDWASFCVRRYGQSELNLTGIGESTMHPNFIENVKMARDVVGWDCNILFTTNGLLITEDLVRAIRHTGVRAFVSAHRPEKAGPAADILRRHGMLISVSFDPLMGAINWAGQVEWDGIVKAPKRECFWVKQGKAIVLADGRLSRCCLDSTGEGVMGHVSDFITKDKCAETSPWHLCRSCDQDVGVPIPDSVPFPKIIPLKKLANMPDEPMEDVV